MSRLCHKQMRIFHGSSLRHQAAISSSWQSRRCWSTTAYSSGKTLLISQLTSISRGRSTIHHLWTRVVAVTALLYVSKYKCIIRETRATLPHRPIDQRAVHKAGRKFKEFLKTGIDRLSPRVCCRPFFGTQCTFSFPKESQGTPLTCGNSMMLSTVWWSHVERN